MRLSRAFLLVPVAVAGSTVSAQAQNAANEDEWFIQIGAARVELAEEAEVTIAGTELPNAGIDMNACYTAVAELGCRIKPAIALTLAVGVPVKQAINGAETLAPYGKLTSVTYGPAAAMVQWHPFRFGRLDPYVGAGAAYSHVCDAQDGTLTNLNASDDIGPAFQIGMAVNIGPSAAMFVDAKKAFLNTELKGSLGPVPVEGRLSLDPLVLQRGLKLRM
ncbi:OmpW/AlkL family protein [Croceicoccus hydrothermalis]|uniref:OmpW/AlkL family protein n=1 Tax=Croceicoccus hydrothermalis TaxID=2867964 RepID=UPI001EFB671F|nr:OmpW family outer membrane protein [Croceicoccus hydrothermalis]